MKCGILTISDRSSSGERPDLSGPTLAKHVSSLGWQVVLMTILPDEQAKISEVLKAWVDISKLDIILTTGGTSCAPRDVTPEATLSVIDRNIPGLAEAMRAKSIAINAHAMLSRLITGIRRKTLIINLPGSPQAALENLQVIESVLPHALSLLHEDPKAENEHQANMNRG
ncbi:MAG: MogA/MoaB family molybdenum cofactor biosynthesis protein [Anaerolineaceae bacterium]|nr:MogA/MoaB family molybdenum cofactor biosynthesis protein [Anaerolineaceae bacterium]